MGTKREKAIQEGMKGIVGQKEEKKADRNGEKKKRQVPPDR